MTELLRPFVGYIPSSTFAQRVVGPPSATLTPEQKRAAVDDPLSFRYTAGRKAGCSHDNAMRWIGDLVTDGVLLPIGPAVVVYRQQTGDFVSTGMIADLSLGAYTSGRVKRHEKTIAKTQRKMANYMRTTRMYGNPAVTAFRPVTLVEETIAGHTNDRPATEYTTVDGIGHSLWLVEGNDASELCRLLDSVLYITDGHHRLAAAALVAADEGKTDARIPVGVFSAGEFRLRSFARCIDDPDLALDAVIGNLETEFELDEVGSDEAFPRTRFEFGAKIGDRYFRLRIPEDRIPADQHLSLNTNLIQEMVLGPVFGITHPRLDKRLRFVADLGEVGDVCPTANVWFLPFHLEVNDVMAVADSDRTMPAKSTWFAPKLPSGLVIRPIGEI